MWNVKQRVYRRNPNDNFLRFCKHISKYWTYITKYKLNICSYCQKNRTEIIQLFNLTWRNYRSLLKTRKLKSKTMKSNMMEILTILTKTRETKCKKVTNHIVLVLRSALIFMRLKCNIGSPIILSLYPWILLQTLSKKDLDSPCNNGFDLKRVI